MISYNTRQNNEDTAGALNNSRRFFGAINTRFVQILAFAAALTLVPAASAVSAPAAGGVASGSGQGLAQLFTQLTHGVERDIARPHLVRYETPVTIALEGPGADGYERFVSDYADRLRRNSGVDIGLGGRAANLHVRFVGQGFFSVAPNVACLVAPGNVRWQELAANPRRYDIHATARMTSMEHMTVFIPASSPRRRTESCLLEEIAQALGPANDLRRFGDTIFNDDDVHMWPTEFDYLMLRVLYSPELRTGMSRAESEQAALRVIERVAGQSRTAVAAGQDEVSARESARVKAPVRAASFAAAGTER